MVGVPSHRPGWWVGGDVRQSAWEGRGGHGGGAEGGSFQIWKINFSLVPEVEKSREK